MSNPTSQMSAALTSFVAIMTQVYLGYMSRAFPTLTPGSYEVTIGGRYAKITHTEGGQRSVTAFVCMTSGDVFKPASWRGPAKGARGNILASDNGRSAIGYSGRIVYAR